MLDKVPITLSREYADILTEIESTPTNLFITGRAGTGKSTLLQLIIKTSQKKIAVVAPTGVAALNVRGQTIHSFFRFPPQMLDPRDIKKIADHRLYKSLDALIIDEVSMVRADMFDQIDIFLRVNRGIDLPFGGLQVIVFGDLFQLPPVVADPFEKSMLAAKYESPYFFSAHIFERGLDIQWIELTKVYRQDEKAFVDLLDRIRLNDLDEYDFEWINTRFAPLPDDHDYFITLCSINATAQAINLKNLGELTTTPSIHKAKVEGMFQKNNYPTDENLVLKEGAQVMFVKNDPQKRFVNGTIGKVDAVSPDGNVLVKIRDSNGERKTIDVEVAEWESIKYSKDTDNSIKAEVVGLFKQLPLKLAWAVTIHKSQGKTFDHCIIDFGRGAFEFGQAYVALSRCRTIGGIYLKQPIRPHDIKVDERVVDFYEKMRRQ